MGEWFGLGRRVIITTRNTSCVANVEDIENSDAISPDKKIYIYQMRESGFDNSLQLLCRHAFSKDVPPCDYEQPTCEIISFTRGVPLAIEGHRIIPEMEERGSLGKNVELVREGAS